MPRRLTTSELRSDAHGDPEGTPSCHAGVVQDADVVEVAISLGVVESVTHHELVGDFEADIAHVHGPQAALGLVHEGGDADGVRLALIQHVHQIVEGYAAIHDVFDN